MRISLDPACEKRRLFAVLAAIAVLVAFSLPAGAQSSFEWSERMSSGQTLEIRGVNGSIEARPAAGSGAEVIATKSARRSDPDEVTIEVVQSEDGFTICAVYPSRRSDRENTCTPGGDPNMRIRNSDVMVEFVVRVPAGVRLVSNTVNGGITVDGIDGDVDASTVNGGIHVETAGVVRAQTVNGSIEGTMGRGDWNDPVEFETTNGTITITIPNDTSAQVEARTTNGSFRSEFPLTVSGRFGPRRMSGRIGTSEGAEPRMLRLRTVNGDIRVRRAS